MIRKLWTFDDYGDFECEIDDLACLKDFIGSPPPPYTTEDLRRNEEQKQRHKDRQISYGDVGEEICVTITKRPNEELGLTILSGDAFEPKWPTILDIRKNSPASRSAQAILIGDQIKELYGIPTEALAHSQVVALFAKATDEVNMKLRRGLEPSDRSFKWYKYPFYTVSRIFDEISVTEEKKKFSCGYDFCDDNEPSPLFSSFKSDDSFESKKSEYSQPVFGIRHVRSSSASSVSKRGFVTHTPRQRRRTVDETRRMEHYKNYGRILPASKQRKENYIVEKIEKLTLDDGSLKKFESRSSLNSAPSISSVSAFSSANNINSAGLNLTHPPWMATVINSSIGKSSIGNSSDDLSLSQSSGGSLEKAMTPVNIIRNSFRRRILKKGCHSEEDAIPTSENSTNSIESCDNTLLVTVWLADRKRLGLKFAGGTVSPYGDGNIYIQEVKENGTANKLFREGDEVLAIDGIATNGLDVKEVNRILGNLEENYVEFKIFRPTH